MPLSGLRVVDLTRLLNWLVSCAPVLAAALALGVAIPAVAQIDARLAGVTVEPASRDRAVYPLPSTLQQFLPIWRGALEDALTRQSIFRPGAPRPVSVVVKVLEFSLSGKILNVLARYQLFDNPPGDPIFSADILSDQGISPLATGVTSLEDPALVTQNRTEVLRGIQDNITQFLDQLAAFAQGRPRPTSPRRSP